MYRFSCFALIGLGVLHLIALGVDAASYAPGWLEGILWTFEHWAGVEDQRRDLVLAGFAFWSTVGSMGVALVGLGYVLLWIDDQGLTAPRLLIEGLVAWALIATLLMPPSGFPLVLLASLGLLTKQRGNPGTKA
ncbi:hypothetical protein BCY90_16140 [Agrobacterium deltaense]|uniref:DUF6463 family protein n=1 Tax=Agrobacterium TaxID=357 RepID=UPI0007459F09|nr:MULTISPECIES: DUF6463 family protein [Agrobacterium]KVK54222.1 hypothetical protein L901_17795 [Agrobacterium sp. D14]RKF41833.1 hypothetical protein BCY90_16140 [Agrobacterium deltaense]